MELAQKSPQWFLRKGKDMVNKAIRDLALYGVRTGLITEADVPYVINRLIDEMKLDDLNKYFYDIWYPVVEDIEIFDRECNWMILISHDGDVGYISSYKTRK